MCYHQLLKIDKIENLYNCQRCQTKYQGLKQRRVKKEENRNQKGGNVANLVNRKPTLQDPIKDYPKKARKRSSWSFLCIILEHFKGYQIEIKEEAR